MSNKTPIMDFMPVGVCGCSQTAVLGRVYEVVRKYRNHVEYNEHSAASETAKKFGVGYRGVVVGNRLLGPTPTRAKIEEELVAEMNNLGIAASKS